jgi:hypothetical protein
VLIDVKNKGNEHMGGRVTVDDATGDLMLDDYEGTYIESVPVNWFLFVLRRVDVMHV